MNRLEQTWTDLNTETQARTQTPERTITTQKTIKYQNAEAIGFLRIACVWKWSTWNCSGLRNLLDISTVSTVCLFPDVFSYVLSFSIMKVCFVWRCSRPKRCCIWNLISSLCLKLGVVICSLLSDLSSWSLAEIANRCRANFARRSEGLIGDWSEYSDV